MPSPFSSIAAWFAVYLLSSATSIAMSSASARLTVAEATRAVPTIGATAARMPRSFSDVDAHLGRRLGVRQIRDRRGIDRDERGDANEHELVRLEARRLDRVQGHAPEQVEQRSLI